MFYGQSEDLTEIINEIVEQKTNEVIENKNYATADEVNEIIENKSYVTEEMLSELENSIAGMGFPNYANRTELTSGVEYTADENMYIVLDTSDCTGYGATTVTLTIDGMTYGFSEGFGGTDWNHPNNAIYPIGKGSVFTFTVEYGKAGVGVAKIYKVYAK